MESGITSFVWPENGNKCSLKFMGFVWELIDSFKPEKPADVLGIHLPLKPNIGGKKLQY